MKYFQEFPHFLPRWFSPHFLHECLNRLWRYHRPMVRPRCQWCPVLVCSIAVLVRVSALYVDPDPSKVFIRKCSHDFANWRHDRKDFFLSLRNFSAILWIVDSAMKKYKGHGFR